MSNKYSYPLLCTRGALVFPMQDLAVEVGRSASITAVNYANAYNTNIVVVTQKDLTIDTPTPDDIYEYGTVCRIKSSREKEDHLKVVFTGISRCKIYKHFVKDETNFVEVEELKDVIENEEEIIGQKLILFDFNFEHFESCHIAKMVLDRRVPMCIRTAMQKCQKFAKIYKNYGSKTTLPVPLCFVL